MPRAPSLLVTRLLLIAAALVVGVAIGGSVGVANAQEADALVGGAMVMLGAMIGGALGLATGALAAWMLPPQRLRLAAWVLGIPAAVLLALGLRAAWLMDQETRDPEKAYAGLPIFVAVLERDPTHDPYLAVRLEVNARTRQWTTELPGGNRCRGRLRAEVQQRVSEMLPGGPMPPACRDAPASGALERVTWDVDAGSAGAALLDNACRAAEPKTAQLAWILSMASSLADSAASCD